LVLERHAVVAEKIECHEVVSAVLSARKLLSMGETGGTDVDQKDLLCCARAHFDAGTRLQEKEQHHRTESEQHDGLGGGQRDDGQRYQSERTESDERGARDSDGRGDDGISGRG